MIIIWHRPSIIADNVKKMFFRGLFLKIIDYSNSNSFFAPKQLLDFPLKKKNLKLRCNDLKYYEIVLHLPALKQG